MAEARCLVDQHDHSLVMTGNLHGVSCPCPGMELGIDEGVHHAPQGQAPVSAVSIYHLWVKSA